MAVTITRKKDKLNDESVKANTEMLANLKMEVDSLRRKLKPLEHQLVAYETEYRIMLDNLVSKDRQGVVQGHKYSLSYGAKPFSTKIKEIGLIKSYLEAIKEGLFFELAKVPIMDLKNYLTPEQLDLCTSEQRTGKRKITVRAITED